MTTRTRLNAELATQQYTRRHAREIVTAMLGNNSGTVVAVTDTRWYWIRLHGDANQVVRAWNTAFVPPIPDLPVDVEVVKANGITDYQILGVSLNRGVAADVNAGATGSHALQHQRRDFNEGGFDALDIYGRAIVQLRARGQATPDMTLHVEAGWYSVAGIATYYAGGNSAAFTAPGTGSRCDLLYLNNAGALQIVTGTPVLSGTPTRPAQPTADDLPLAYVYLESTTTSITEYLIEDGRMVFGGAGGGVGAHSILSATHSDTTVSTPDDLDVLTWNAGSSRWIAAANSAAGSLTNPLINVTGVLAVVQNIGAYIATQTQTIHSVYIYSRVPGTASSTIVGVRKNGIDVFTTQANRPTLAFNDANRVAESVQPDLPNLVENDVLEFDIAQVATGATDLAVEVVMTDTAPALANVQLVANPNAGTINECVCRAIANGKVFWSSHRATDPTNGHEYVWDGVSNIDIDATTGLACWNSVFNSSDNLIYSVGQVLSGGIYRAVVRTINPVTNAVTTVLMNAAGQATGDCNELIGVLDDGTQLVTGERYGGGLAGGSDFTNGGGLWTIPKATLSTPATHTRVYEDTHSPTWEWTGIAKHGTKYIALLNSAAGNGKYVVQRSTNLTAWTVDVDGSALSLGQDVFAGLTYHVAQNKVYAAVLNASRQVVLHEYNGSAWSSTTFTAITAPATGTVNLVLKEYLGGLLLFMGKTSPSNLHNIYTITNLSTTPSASVRYTGVSNFSTVVPQTNGADIYYCTIHNGALRVAT